MAQPWKSARTVSVCLLLLGIALVPSVALFAQRKEGPVTVTGVSSRKTGDGAVVTVSADAPLTRTQTWQDEEGFHLVMTGAGPGAIKGLPRGVMVRNLGKSLEVVVAVKPGAGVTVDPRFNNLNLIVKGGLDTIQGDAQLDPPSRKSRPAEERVEPSLDYEPISRQQRERRPLVDSASPASFPAREQDLAPRQTLSTNEQALNPKSNTTAAGMVTPAASPTGSPQAGASAAGTAPQQLVPPTDQGIVPAGQEAAPAATTVAVASSEGDGLFSYIFSTTGVLVLLLLCGAALVLVRRHRATQEDSEVKEEKSVKVEEDELIEVVSVESPLVAEERPKKERRKMFRRKSDKSLVKVNAQDNHEVDSRGESGTLEKRAVAPVQPALYGAYRVDQEVGKLVLGQAHRLDVLSSRAPDDRRAIETSLLKAMNSAESGDEGRRRAREALEEYGFVARQCASLLLSNNAYDRASAARSLGEINSPASLPFLLEALYDTEGIVRAEAVTSLGSLKMPSAIGALIDMARRYPEMPAALLSRALSACSVECLDFFDTTVPERPLLEAGDDPYVGEITHLDPAIKVEELPEWFEDEELAEALAGLQDANAEVRASAARRLAQFQVQRSVEALTLVAANDTEATVRAAAVTSLGEIEHESVFAPVMVAFADDAREVRAAAARSLSRMNFDRGEAYVRLIETADADTLRKVAQSCTKAGMVTQAIDRLISEDRRLAYEAFSLLSLLAKSGETEPLIDAISSHPEVNIRLAVVRLVGTSSRPEAANLLRHLAVRDGLPEKVRSALMEVVYKIDQAQLV